jgi:hypothetical protein
VRTPSGWRRIECLEVGDEVESWDEERGVVVVGRVSELYSAEVTSVVALAAGALRLAGVSPEHPFYVDGSGWSEVGALSSGTRVLGMEDGVVRALEVFEHQVISCEPTEVFNLHVEEYETYFAEGFLVHNKTPARQYDHDGDHYYEPADCAPENAAINPGAREQCSDGVDNDCDGDVDGKDDECRAAPQDMVVIGDGPYALVCVGDPRYSIAMEASSSGPALRHGARVRSAPISVSELGTKGATVTVGGTRLQITSVIRWRRIKDSSSELHSYSGMVLSVGKRLFLVRERQARDELRQIVEVELLDGSRPNSGDSFSIEDKELELRPGQKYYGLVGSRGVALRVESEVFSK